MKKKICPYCDQPMGDGIYCRECRRIVLRPAVWNVDYYLNERHPASEENCQYHGDLHTGEMNQKPKPASVVKNSRPAAKRASQAGSRRKDRSPLSRVAAVLIIYFILMFAGTLINFAANANLKNARIDQVFHMFQSNVPESETAFETTEEELTDTTEESQLEEWERSDEEVIAAGEVCNAYGHFPVSASVFQWIFEEKLVESGHTEWSKDVYSRNTVQDGWTWFETETFYNGYNPEFGEYIAVLNYDTVTGEIHGVYWYADGEEELLRLADAVVESFREAGISEDGPDGRELYEEARAADGTVILEHGFEIFAVGPQEDGDDFCQMMLWAPGCYTDGE